MTQCIQELEIVWTTGLCVRKPSNSDIHIRLALTCVNCDLPANRKLCGFLGHTANLGCNKCYKKFGSSIEGGTAADYSGFDRGNWVFRDNWSH